MKQITLNIENWDSIAEGARWDRIRKAIYKRDKNTCVVCKNVCDKRICHHLNWDTGSLIPDLDLYITLCSKCHGKLARPGIIPTKLSEAKYVLPEPNPSLVGKLSKSMPLAKQNVNKLPKAEHAISRDTNKDDILQRNTTLYGILQRSKNRVDD